MTYWCESAWLPTGLERRVRVEVKYGLISAVTPATDPLDGDERLSGVVLPGMADAHSHAFHRALRGRTHGDGGSFWTWREVMYRIADRLDPDSLFAIARACYAELLQAGVTAVGEFHYVHHRPGGGRYDDPNAMSAALAAAAAEAGIRLTLLDTCYLAGGLGPDGYLPLDPVQLRFGDQDAEDWAIRVAEFAAVQPKPGTPHWLQPEAVRVGVAAHSVRAVPREQLPTVAELATTLRDDAQPVPAHVHLSEQPAENRSVQAVFGCSPAELLAQAGLLGPHATAVHATHLDDADIARLGRSGTTACFCPSTEADLADGIGPAWALHSAGSPLALGSDQHVLDDLLTEARLLESGERLATNRRGRFSPAELIDVLTVNGHAAIGRPEGGQIAPGAPADLVAVSMRTASTAGSDPRQIALTARASDVRTVIVGGRPVVRDGEHRLGDIGRLLADAIAPLWEEA